MKRLIFSAGLLLVVSVTLAFVKVNPEELSFTFLNLEETLEQIEIPGMYHGVDVDNSGQFIVYGHESDVFYVSTIDDPLTGILYSLSDFGLSEGGFVEFAIHENTVVAIEEDYRDEGKIPIVRVFKLDLTKMSSEILYHQELEAWGLPFGNIHISPDGRFVGFTVVSKERREDSLPFHTVGKVKLHLLDLKTGKDKILTEFDHPPDDWTLGNNGTLLMCFQDGKIKYLKLVKDGVSEKEFELEAGLIPYSLTFLDEHRAAVYGGSKRIHILDLESGKVEAILTGIPSISRLFAVKGNLVGINPHIARSNCF